MPSVDRAIYFIHKTDERSHIPARPKPASRAASRTVQEVTSGMETVPSNAPLIAHVDLDSFFAAAEILRRPELKDHPVAVGGRGARGVIATANYPARAFGVGSAMATREALRRCPQLVVLPGDFSWYRTLSFEVLATLADFAADIEPMSLDEAFLLLGSSIDYSNVTTHAAALRLAVRERTGLTISFGAGPTRTIAKLASDFAKPDGLHIVDPGHATRFLAKTKLSSLGGVGPATQKALERIGVETVTQLAATPLATLSYAVGVAQAEHLHAMATATDSAELFHRGPPSSVGAETTLESDAGSFDEFNRAVEIQGREALRRLARLGMGATGVAVKARTTAFRDLSRAQALAATNSPALLATAWRQLAKRVYEDAHSPVRLVGVTFTGLTEAVQGNLFTESGWQLRRAPRVGETVRHARFGEGFVVVGDPDTAVVRFADQVRIIDDPRSWLSVVHTN